MKWQIYWQIYPPLASSGKEWPFHIYTIRLLLADEVADLLADLTPPVLASSGKEWQFHISIVRAHIGR